MTPPNITVAQTECQHGQWGSHFLKDSFGNVLLDGMQWSACPGGTEIWIHNDTTIVNKCEVGTWEPALFDIHVELKDGSGYNYYKCTNCDGHGWTHLEGTTVEQWCTTHHSPIRSEYECFFQDGLVFSEDNCQFVPVAITPQDTP